MVVEPIAARKNLVGELRRITSLNRVICSPVDLICYSYDATRIQKVPLAIVKARTTAEVAAVLRFASSHGVPVTPRGSGTGLSGGSVPDEDGIVLDLTLMNRVIDFDVHGQRATVEAGVITYELDAMAAEHGCMFPPDPSSYRVTTIGGNIAENAGGLRGLKYGVTADYIEELEVVLPTGEVIWLSKEEPVCGVGLNLFGLVPGSEGTLCVVTKATLAIRKLPASRKSAFAIFGVMQDAAVAVNRIIDSGVVPATLEVLDNITIKAVEEFKRIGLPTDAGAILLVEVDGDEITVGREMEKVAEAIRRARARELRVARDEAEREELWAARRAALSALARVRPSTILEDATVPRSKMAELISEVERISNKYGLLIGNFGHAGDGNLHPTILADLRDPEEQEKVEMAIGEIFEATVKLEGTLSGEHGIGLAKSQYMPLEFSAESLQVMAEVKKALDPKNILNPGKILPEQALRQKALA